MHRNQSFVGIGGVCTDGSIQLLVHAETPHHASAQIVHRQEDALLAGGINLVTPIAFFGVAATQSHGPVLSIVPVLVFGIMLLCGIAILVGAFQMLRQRWYFGAMLASIVALIPSGPAWPLSLPFGILALVALNRNEVRQAFALAD